jgi:alkanesulfonate monooxygenase SsuD/methylene tetrahydromethanopterin reductase-like flavin-dependent oxidoreductase (luciferase family)
VWIGGSAPPAIERAARLGDAWIAGPWSTHAELLEQLQRYREARAAQGLDPGVAVVRRDVHVAEDDARARDEAAAVLAAGYRGFGDGVTVVGGVDAVADELATLAAMGYDEVLVRHLVDDEGAVLRSYALLGDVRLRVAGAGPVTPP